MLIHIFLYQKLETLTNVYERVRTAYDKLQKKSTRSTIVSHHPVLLTNYYKVTLLTHWGRVTHTCVIKQTIIGSDNSLSPCLSQGIIWSNVGILLIRTLGTNFSEIINEIHKFSFGKAILKCRLENGGHFVSASTYEQNVRTYAAFPTLLLFRNFKISADIHLAKTCSRAEK